MPIVVLLDYLGSASQGVRNRRVIAWREQLPLIPFTIIGVGISILSYAGKVFFGLIADRACIPEPAQVVDRLHPEFEQLLLAATVGVLGLQQRKPRRRKRTTPTAGNT